MAPSTCTNSTRMPWTAVRYTPVHAALALTMTESITVGLRTWLNLLQFTVALLTLLAIVLEVHLSRPWCEIASCGVMVFLRPRWWWSSPLALCLDLVAVAIAVKWPTFPRQSAAPDPVVTGVAASTAASSSAPAPADAAPTAIAEER